VVPAEQVWLHTPAEQTVPGVEQWVPQAPQLLGSVLKDVQSALAPEPHALGVPTGHPQTPALQCWPSGQALPHEPQFASSVASVVQKLPVPEPQ
jgi:hypothetical protein